MKLNEILKDRSIRYETVDVDFKHEVETDDEFDYIPMTAHVKVTITPDMFDTGDSPTGHDAVIISVTNKRTGKSEEMESLHLDQGTIDSILDKAVDKVD
jgi:hypothetical protein